MTGWSGVRDIDLILREEADTWGAWSPTVVGLYVTADSAHECTRLAAKAADAELDEPVGLVRVHHERVVDGLVIRVAGQRPGFEARIAVAQRLEDLIHYDRAQIDDDGLIRNSAGEVVFVCALADDPVGWLAAQLDRRGDGLQVAVLLDHTGRPTTSDVAFIWSAGVVAGQGSAGPTLEESGMSLNTTIGEYLRRGVQSRPEDLPDQPVGFLATRAVALA
jgi:hypothetical protein